MLKNFRGIVLKEIFLRNFLKCLLGLIKAINKHSLLVDFAFICFYFFVCVCGGGGGGGGRGRIYNFCKSMTHLWYSVPPKMLLDAITVTQADSNFFHG